MDKRFAYGAVNFRSIPSWVKPMTLKLIFTASLLDAQHQRDNVKNKPASLLFGKDTWRDFLHLSVVDSWPAAVKRARYSALIALSG